MSVNRLTCPSCDAKLKVSGAPGSRVKCPRCGKAIRVPEPEEEVELEEVEEDDEPAPKKRRDAVQPAPSARKAKRPPDDEEDFEVLDDEDEDEEPAPKKRDAIRGKPSAAPSRKAAARPRDEDEEDEDDRPRRRGKGRREKEKKGSGALLWVGLGGGALLLIVGVILAILFLLPKAKEQPAQAQAPPPSVPPAPKGPGSPKDVFDAFLAAWKRKDVKAVSDCLTPEGRRAVAGSQVKSCLALRQTAALVGTGDATNKVRTIAPAMDRHGLTLDAMAKVPPASATNPADAERYTAALVALARDPDALFTDLLTAAFADIPELIAIEDATLKDLKESGDRATGTVTASAAGLSKTETFLFVRAGDGWKLTPGGR